MQARRVTVVPGGPLLVEGPVEVELPDGSVVRSERPVVALCVCRRSRRQPWCDTSHRARSRDEPPAADQQPDQQPDQTGAPDQQPDRPGG